MCARSTTILLIDDSPEQRDLYQHIFCHSPFRIVVLSSSDIHTLEDTLTKTQPFFILTDYRTIQPHYADVVQVLNTAGRSIPNAIVTTSCDDDLCEAFDYAILKPFTAGMLRKIVTEVHAD